MCLCYIPQSTTTTQVFFHVTVPSERAEIRSVWWWWSTAMSLWNCSSFVPFRTTFLHDGGPYHCPSFRINAPGFDVTFDPIPQIPNPCRWPAEHLASACACAHLQGSGWCFPPLKETWIYCSIFVRHLSLARIFHQVESISLGWRTCDEAAETPVSGILRSLSSSCYFGGFLVAS